MKCDIDSFVASRMAYHKNPAGHTAYDNNVLSFSKFVGIDLGLQFAPSYPYTNPSSKQKLPPIVVVVAIDA